MTVLDTRSETEEQSAFRAEARAWLEANAPRRHLDSREFKRRVTARGPDNERASVAAARDWQRRIADAGFAGISVPRDYGGRGASSALERVWRQEVVRYEIDLGVFSVALGMVVPTLLAHGTEDQKRRFLAPVLRGEEVWCQLFSEPGAGSDLAGLTTRAERDGDEWVVNGQKVWNSFAHLADWGILLARTNWDVPKHRGITYFLVDMRTPGVEARPLRQITGVAHFNETFLTDVRIPHDQVLGDINGGWGVAQTTLMNERALIGGAALLGFRDYLDLARQYGRTADPSVRQTLAAAYTRFEILRWLGQRAQAARPRRTAARRRELGRQTRDVAARGPQRRPVARPRRRRRHARRGGRLRGRVLAATVPRPVGDPDRGWHRAGAAQHPRGTRSGPAPRAATRQDRAVPRHPQERLTAAARGPSSYAPGPVDADEPGTLTAPWRRPR